MKSIFVYNPESGKGKIKKHKDYILKKLREKYGEVECVETSFAGHASKLAHDSIGKYDYFFVSGGDGTLNEVINGMGEAENKPIIGYLPSGTVNDVARSLEIPRLFKRAVSNMVNGVPFAHDIFKVNSRYGIYVCCAGLFTSSSYSTKREAKKNMGKVAYFFDGAKEIFKTKPVKVELIADGEVIKKNCALVLILNSRSVAGFRLNKKASLDDGSVEVVLIHSHEQKIKLFEIMKCLETFVLSLDQTKKSKGVTYKKLSNFTIKTSEGTVINLDGEKSGEGSFDFSVIKQGVKILIPKRSYRKLTGQKV